MTIRLNRITVEEVKQAYSKTGLKPIKGKMFNQNGCCALGALFVSRFSMQELLDLDHKSELYDYFQDIYGKDYIRGFWFGFDNFTSVNDAGHTADHILGYNDGQIASYEVFKEES